VAPGQGRCWPLGCCPQGLGVCSGTGCRVDFASPPSLRSTPIIHCRTGRFVGNAVTWLCTPSARRSPQCVPTARLLLGFEDPKGSPGYLRMLGSPRRSELPTFGVLSSPCQVRHLLSCPEHGHSSSRPSCLASPAPLLGLALPWRGAVPSAGLSPC